MVIDCQRLQSMTESNKNQPKQIKCKTWLHKWFSQFQQVSVHGPDCSRSRGNCETEEQDRRLFLDFVWNQVRYRPTLHRRLMGCSDAMAPKGVMERMPERVWPPGWPWVLPFNTFSTKVLWLCAHVATRSQHCSRHIRGSTCTILPGDVPWQCVLLLPSLVLRAPVWYSSCPSRCSPGQRCPVRR